MKIVLKEGELSSGMYEGYNLFCSQSHIIPFNDNHFILMNKNTHSKLIDEIIKTLSIVDPSLEEWYEKLSENPKTSMWTGMPITIADIEDNEVIFASH